MCEHLWRSGPGSSRRLYRYEMRIRSRIAPAVTQSFPLPVDDAVVSRRTVRRLMVIRDEDDAVDRPAVMTRLTECDVAIVDVRLRRPAAPRRGRAS